MLSDLNKSRLESSFSLSFMETEFKTQADEVILNMAH